MGQALYRKYRSKSLAEIVGQEHVTTALTNALKTGRISHAYLFTGPRGVGKTSIARILAHEINQLPYQTGSLPIDIIEIDAASNNGVEDARDLRDKVHTAPVSAPYKVYIIDEVHMLSKAAFNALLKTLEEPPKHVVFILATTETHKLPETIISRTQRYAFKPIAKGSVINHLKEIAQKENIDVTDEALELIAEHGGGSFRDSISLLDQAGNSAEKVDADTVLAMLGMAPEHAIKKLYETTKTSTPKEVLAVLSDMYQSGYQAAQIAKQLGVLIRGQIIANEPNKLAVWLNISKALVEVPATNDPEINLELALLDANMQLVEPKKPADSTPEPPTDISTSSSSAIPPKSTDSKPQATTTKPPTKSHASTPKDTPEEDELLQSPVKAEATPDPVANELVDGATSDLDLTTIWPELLAVLQKTHNTLHSVLKTATPQLNTKGLTLAFRYAFHQKRIADIKNRTIVANALATVSGSALSIECVLDADLPPDTAPVKPAKIKQPEPTDTPPARPGLDAISNIFGGAEVLES